MPGIRITDHSTTCLLSVRLGFTSDFDQEIGQDLHQIDIYSLPYQRPRFVKNVILKIVYAKKLAAKLINANVLNTCLGFFFLQLDAMN